MVTNPSIELATTGYTASGGSIARSSAQQYHGVYSLAVTPTAGTTDGAYYLTSTLTSGTPYIASCKFKGVAGVPYALTIATTGGSDLTVTQFTATGRWQWVKTPVYLETSSTTRRIYFRKANSANAGVFYVDGVQLEACADGTLDATTYIDGDQLGLLVGQQPPAYLWNGTPHASTSTRSALTRAGGYVVNLSTYNFLLTALIGLGMATPNNVSIPYTVLDGARYERTTKPPRTIALSGRFQADNVYDLMTGQSDMRAAFDRDLVAIQQPMVLQVEPQDECGNVIGDFAQIQCLYAGGLEGNAGNLPAEDVAPAFTMYVPYLIGGSGGVALDPQDSVANANFIAKRAPNGTWSALSTGLNGAVNVIIQGPDGLIYVGGNFTNAGGIAAADYIATWNPVTSAWGAVGTGMDAQVNALVFDAAGILYAGGDFANAGGGAAAHVASWNGAAWSAMSTGMTGGIGATVRALAVDADGLVYAGGNFTDAGGSGADYIARWGGLAWSVLGSATALNNQVYSLLYDVNTNRVYVGGAFTDAGAVGAADRIAYWNVSSLTWNALSTGLDNTVFALARLPNSVLVAGGSFTTAGGLSLPYIAQYNGNQWQSLGTVNNTVTRLFLGSGGNLLYASGDLTTANGVTLPDSAAMWNGSTWLPIDIDLPGASTPSAGIATTDGSIYMGFKTSGTATSPGFATAQNVTQSYTWPTITINGPSSGTARLYQVVNFTTGFGIWLNYSIQSGEVITIVTDPTNPSFVSSITGDLTSKILPGSQPSLLYLAPGANTISFFAASSTVTATMSWQSRYNGPEDLVN